MGRVHHSNPYMQGTTIPCDIICVQSLKLVAVIHTYILLMTYNHNLAELFCIGLHQYC